MSLPHPRLVLDLFERLSGDRRLWSALRPEGAAFSRQRIYTLGAVVRLMILQRLLPQGTLTQAVQQLLQSQRESNRPDPHKISARAGAYCRARQKLPTLVAIEVFDRIVEQLRGWLPRNPVLPDRPIFVLDGTTLTLPHTPDLVSAYPPSRNQHGVSHWPMLRLVVLQDVQTGLALRPHGGPYRGPQAVSEQQLALEAIPHLPEQAVVLGDRNFGVFAVAWTAAQHRRPALLRLTRLRAEALAGAPLTAPSQQTLCGRPTRLGSLRRSRAGAGQRLRAARWPSSGSFVPRAIPLLLHDARSAARGSQRPLSPALERGNRFALHQANRSPATTLVPLGRPLGKRALPRSGRLQSRARRPLSGRRKGPGGSAPREFYQRLHARRNLSARPQRCSHARQWHTCWDRILSLATDYILPHRTKPRSYPRASWRRPSRSSRT